jgi:phosphatidylserine decarboxylase
VIPHTSVARQSMTNRIPRRLATQFMGWFSQIEQPFMRDLSIGIWSGFSDLDLSEAKKTRFTSIHDCFIRELRMEPDRLMRILWC